MDAIAAEAGVSKLTVYSHFVDKDALFKAVIAEKCGSLSPPERFQQLADDGPERCLTRIAEGFTELMAHPDVIAMHRLVTSEAANNPRIAKLLYEAGPERYKSAFGALLKTFHERGELRVPGPDVAGEQFFHMLKDEYHQRLLLNLKPKVTRATRLHYARACAQTFLRAFRPPTEGQ
jgi:TetR/AcrR family transcriptional repressor of mexJK operon